MDDNFIAKLHAEFGAEVTACGSRVTCNPAPIDTDADFLVVVDSHRNLSELVGYLDEQKWHWEGATEHYQDLARDTFMSWRKSNENLIVTTNTDFAQKHKIATRICTRLNLMNKQDRIMVFQSVLYGNTEWGV